MKIKLQRGNEETEGTFRISSLSREFDGPEKGGVIISMWRCPTERKKPEDDMTLTLTIEAYEIDTIVGKLPEDALAFTVKVGER